MKSGPVTSTYQVDFARRSAPPPTVAPTGRLPRVARMLALAHRIDGMIRTGELRDLAHAAKICGLTRARVTQVCNLLHLAPAIQEAILELPPATNGCDPISERSLRTIVAEPQWDRQRELWKQVNRGSRETCADSMGDGNQPQGISTSTSSPTTRAL